MKINITKKQYETLLKTIAVSQFVYGALGDFVDEKYKKESTKLEELERHLASHAKDFGFEEITEEFEGERVIKMEGDWYHSIYEDIEEYDEYKLFQNLANKLGWRDFRRDHTKEEIDKMAEESGGYLGVPLYDYEKKYYDEFSEHDYSRLEINKDAPISSDAMKGEE